MPLIYSWLFSFALGHYKIVMLVWLIFFIHVFTFFSYEEIVWNTSLLLFS